MRDYGFEINGLEGSNEATTPTTTDARPFQSPLQSNSPSNIRSSIEDIVISWATVPGEITHTL
jgi:hypothetical protein